jgi:hypothetical protein
LLLLYIIWKALTELKESGAKFLKQEKINYMMYSAFQLLVKKKAYFCIENGTKTLHVYSHMRLTLAAVAWK